MYLYGFARSQIVQLFFVVLFCFFFLFVFFFFLAWNQVKEENMTKSMKLSFIAKLKTQNQRVNLNFITLPTIFPLQKLLIYFFVYYRKHKKPTHCTAVIISNNSSQFYWLKELTIYKETSKKKVNSWQIQKFQPFAIFSIPYHFASKKTRNMLNHNAKWQ